MADNMLGLVPNDVEKKMNPTGDINYKLLVSSGGKYPDEEAVNKIEDKTEYVLSRMPERYRMKCDEFQGQILTDFALEGEAVFTPAILPIVEGTLFLYKNWFLRWFPNGACSATDVVSPIDYDNLPVTFVPYSQRTKAFALDASEFTYDPEAGTITLTTPLKKGETLYADYKHTGLSGCRYLRGCALDLIAAAILEEYPYGQGNVLKRMEDFRNQGYGDLTRLTRGEAGLQFFDKIKCVPEFATRNATGKVEFESLGGFL